DTSNSQLVAEQSGDTDAEPDLDEFAVIVQKNFAELDQATGRITTAVNEHGTRMVNRTKEVKELIANKQTTTGSLKKVLTKTAVDMDVLSTRLEAEIPILNKSMRNGVEAIIGATMLVAAHPAAARVLRNETGVYRSAVSLRQSIESCIEN